MYMSTIIPKIEFNYTLGATPPAPEKRIVQLIDCATMLDVSLEPQTINVKSITPWLEAKLVAGSSPQQVQFRLVPDGIHPLPPNDYTIDAFVEISLPIDESCETPINYGPIRLNLTVPKGKKKIRIN